METNTHAHTLIHMIIDAEKTHTHEGTVQWLINASQYIFLKVISYLEWYGSGIFSALRRFDWCSRDRLMARLRLNVQQQQQNQETHVRKKQD